MTVVFSDDFERADNVDLGANWTPFFAANGGDQFGIVSGVAKPPVTTGNDRGEVATTTLAGDHWAECVLNSSGSGGGGSGCGPLVRCSGVSSSFSYYRLVGNGAGWEITEWGGGGFVGSLASGSGTTFTANDTAYLEWQASTWRAKKGTANGAGGSQFSTGSDSTLNANIRAGIGYSTDDGANSGIRAFVMGDFAAGGDTLMAQISM